MAENSDIDVLSVTIAAAASLSTALAIGGKSIVGFVMPAAWTAAALSLVGSVDDMNYNPVFDGATGNQVQYTVAAAQQIAVDPTKLKGVRNIKLQSGTTAAPVAQVAQAVIQVIVRTVF
jgi:hypothetical protein